MTEHEAATTFAPVPFDPGRPPPAEKKKPPGRKPNRDTPTQPRTKADLCLLAIARLEEVWKRGGVPKTAIVVEAWEASARAAFGLEGYEDQYPDSNRVIMELVKMKSIQKTVRQPKPNHYTLTEAGREAVGRLRKETA